MPGLMSRRQWRRQDHTTKPQLVDPSVGLDASRLMTSVQQSPESRKSSTANKSTATARTVLTSDSLVSSSNGSQQHLLERQQQLREQQQERQVLRRKEHKLMLLRQHRQRQRQQATQIDQQQSLSSVKLAKDKNPNSQYLIDSTPPFFPATTPPRLNITANGIDSVNSSLTSAQTPSPIINAKNPPSTIVDLDQSVSSSGSTEGPGLAAKDRSQTNLLGISGFSFSVPSIREGLEVLVDSQPTWTPCRMITHTPSEEENGEDYPLAELSYSDFDARSDHTRVSHASTEVATNRAIDIAKKRVRKIEESGQYIYEVSAGKPEEMRVASLNTKTGDTASSPGAIEMENGNPVRYVFGAPNVSPRTMEARSLLSLSSNESGSNLCQPDGYLLPLKGKLGRHVDQAQLEFARSRNIMSFDDSSRQSSLQSRSISSSIGVEIHAQMSETERKALQSYLPKRAGDQIDERMTPMENTTSESHYLSATQQRKLGATRSIGHDLMMPELHPSESRPQSAPPTLTSRTFRFPNKTRDIISSMAGDVAVPRENQTSPNAENSLDPVICPLSPGYSSQPSLGSDYVSRADYVNDAKRDNSVQLTSQNMQQKLENNLGSNPSRDSNEEQPKMMQPDSEPSVLISTPPDNPTDNETQMVELMDRVSHVNSRRIGGSVEAPKIASSGSQYRIRYLDANVECNHEELSGVQSSVGAPYQSTETLSKSRSRIQNYTRAVQRLNRTWPPKAPAEAEADSIQPVTQLAGNETGSVPRRISTDTATPNAASLLVVTQGDRVHANRSGSGIRSIRSAFEGFRHEKRHKSDDHERAKGGHEEKSTDIYVSNVPVSGVHKMKAVFEPKNRPVPRRFESGTELRQASSKVEGHEARLKISEPADDNGDDDTASVKSLKDRFEEKNDGHHIESEVSRIKAVFEPRKHPMARKFVSGNGSLREAFSKFESAEARISGAMSRRIVQGRKEQNDRKGSLGKTNEKLSSSNLSVFSTGCRSLPQPGQASRSWMHRSTSYQARPHSRDLNKFSLKAPSNSKTEEPRIAKVGLHGFMDDFPDDDQITTDTKLLRSRSVPSSTGRSKLNVGVKEPKRLSEAQQNPLNQVKIQSTTEILESTFVPKEDANAAKVDPRLIKRAAYKQGRLAATESAVIRPIARKPNVESLSTKVTVASTFSEVPVKSRHDERTDTKSSPPRAVDSRAIPRESNERTARAIMQRPGAVHAAYSAHASSSQSKSPTENRHKAYEPSETSSEFSDGVTLELSVAEVSCLTTPTALLSTGGVEVMKVELEEQSGTMSAKTSSDVVESKRSEASSSQTSEAAAPLIAKAMLRLSDDTSTDSFFVARAIIANHWGKTSGWDSRDPPIKEESSDHQSDEEGLKEEMSSGWDLERVSSSFPMTTTTGTAGEDIFDFDMSYDLFPAATNSSNGAVFAEREGASSNSSRSKTPTRTNATRPRNGAGNMSQQNPRDESRSFVYLSALPPPPPPPPPQQQPQPQQQSGILRAPPPPPPPPPTPPPVRSSPVISSPPTVPRTINIFGRTHPGREPREDVRTRSPRSAFDAAAGLNQSTKTFEASRAAVPDSRGPPTMETAPRSLESSLGPQHAALMERLRRLKEARMRRSMIGYGTSVGSIGSTDIFSSDQGPPDETSLSTRSSTNFGGSTFMASLEVD